MTIGDTANDEGVKGWFHAVAGAYASVLCAHNLKQAIVTGEKRNVVNVALYGIAAWYELNQARQHWAE